MSSDLPRAPTRTGLMMQTLWPSFRRVVVAIFSVLGLPVFLVSVIGFSKLMSDFGWIDFTGIAGTLLQYFDAIQTWIQDHLKRFGVSLPPALVSGALVYLSFGNTIARSEGGEILALETNAEERKENLKDAVSKAHIDAAYYAIPKFLRSPVLRLTWPLVAIHRLGTPFVVEGPGPSGDEISSSIQRGDLLDFAEMVSEAEVWNEQTVYDQRQLVLWHFLLMSGASAALQGVAARLG